MASSMGNLLSEVGHPSRTPMECTISQEKRRVLRFLFQQFLSGSGGILRSQVTVSLQHDAVDSLAEPVDSGGSQQAIGESLAPFLEV